jgi:hypothetical protein
MPPASSSLTRSVADRIFSIEEKQLIDQSISRWWPSGQNRLKTRHLADDLASPLKMGILVSVPVAALGLWAIALGGRNRVNGDALLRDGFGLVLCGAAVGILTGLKMDHSNHETLDLIRRNPEGATWLDVYSHPGIGSRASD